MVVSFGRWSSLLDSPKRRTVAGLAKSSLQLFACVHFEGKATFVLFASSRNVLEVKIVLLFRCRRPLVLTASSYH